MLNSQVQLCQTGQLTNKWKCDVCSKDFSPYISGFKRCDSEKPGFWPNLRGQRKSSKKPGFWPPCDSEKPGFWPNLGGQRNISKKPGFWASCDSEKPGFWPNLQAHTQYLEKTRFLARRVLNLSAASF